MALAKWIAASGDENGMLNVVIRLCLNFLGHQICGFQAPRVRVSFCRQLLLLLAAVNSTIDCRLFVYDNLC